MLRRVVRQLSLFARPAAATATAARTGTWSLVQSKLATAAFSSGEERKSEAGMDVSEEAVQKKIAELVKSNRVVLFMKGSPENPQCGFSRAAVKILAAEEVDDYVFADVLKSPALREGVKKFSDWPTIPQLFVDGQFLGGCDLAIEMHKSGELKKLLHKNKNENEN